MAFWDIPEARLANRRVPLEKAAQVVALLCEGNPGIRACERLSRLNRRTVLAILRVAGEKAARLLDEKIRNVHVCSVQCDELYSFVHCKEFNNTLKNDEWGEQYTFLAVDRNSKMILSYHIGKRSPQSAQNFIWDLRGRIGGQFQLTTDGFRAYAPVVSRAWGQYIHFAQQTKLYSDDIPMPRWKGHLRRPRGCLEVKNYIRIGNPDPALISTSHVERMNLTIRLFNRRFTRLTLGYSKTLGNLRHSVALLIAYFNFCRLHSALDKQTPAMAIGLSNHVWTIEELLST